MGPGHAALVIMEPDRKARFEHSVARMADRLLTWPNDEFSSDGLYLGRSGVALFLRAYGLWAGDASSLVRSDELLESSARWMASTGKVRSLGLFGGITGVALAHLLTDEAPEDDAYAAVDALIAKYLRRLREDRSTAVPYELTGGLTGLGLYGLARVRAGGSSELLQSVVAFILAQAIRRGDHLVLATDKLPQDKRPLPNRYVDLGLAHGMAGPVRLLADAAGVVDAVDGDTVRGLARSVADALAVAPQSYLSLDPAAPIQGILTEPAELTSWCTGSLGMALALTRAGRVFADPVLESCGWGVLERILAVDPRTERSSCLCHGMAGVALVLARSAELSGRYDFRRASENWGDAVLDAWTRELQPEPGLFPGAAGVGMALLYLLGARSPLIDLFFAP